MIPKKKDGIVAKFIVSCLVDICQHCIAIAATISCGMRHRNSKILTLLLRFQKFVCLGEFSCLLNRKIAFKG